MIVLKGVKHWRKKIVRLFVKQKKHFKIVSFHEEAPITFNGCRRQKKRRL
jgi:ribosomal protein S11